MLVTVPSELSIVPELNMVVAPSWFRRFPSVTLMTCTRALSKPRLNWAPEIGTSGSTYTLRAKLWPSSTCWVDGEIEQIAVADAGPARFTLNSSKENKINIV